MKTAMQELLEWVRATLPMDLDTPRLIEEKIESLLQKEKEQIMDAYERGFESQHDARVPQSSGKYYNETFNTNEK